jgi:hypothetical protein
VQCGDPDHDAWIDSGLSADILPFGACQSGERLDQTGVFKAI